MWALWEDQHSIGPFLGPTSILRAIALFYGTTDTLHVSYIKDQDSLNSTAGGNFLDRMPREYLGIIESKSKVRYSRNKPVVAKVSTTASTSGISPDVAELKDMLPSLKQLDGHLIELKDVNDNKKTSIKMLVENEMTNPLYVIPLDLQLKLRVRQGTSGFSVLVISVIKLHVSTEDKVYPTGVPYVVSDSMSFLSSNKK
uniref:Reverse transcriptase domain-containing protein n=1 Tax=Tanacetum cinerariifolium TaxID=118510 RepID=A0A6L2KBE8_TANCI|nr:hypothetical protein [Tanacetum cinerariifolium]